MVKSRTPSTTQLDLFASFDGTASEPTPPSGIALLPDGADRWRIAHDLSTSLFVEAGAGAGKTTMLATRVVGLVASGVPVGSIAAITFTEKAAAELRARVRDHLESALRTGDRGTRGMPLMVTDTERNLLAEALADLDGAAIGTLHSFAQRILREFPIAAGLPPAFSVADEVASDLAFEKRWIAYLDDVLSDDQRAELIMYGSAVGIGVDDLRAIAESFTDNWDLVGERVALHHRPPASFDCQEFLDALERVVTSTQPPPGDKVETEFLPALRTLLLRARVAPDDFALLERVAAVALNATRWGNKTYWRHAPGGEAALAAFRTDVAVCAQLRDSAVRRYKAAWTLAIGAELGYLTLAGAFDRRERGELDFQDLLVLARNLLRHDDDVRAVLHDRYRCLLLDEFQDTDPIQLEIAVRLASPSEPTRPASAGTVQDWRMLRPLPGRLFIVGDPKQSIYRFRRADMAMYLDAQDRLPVDHVALTTNFRSRSGVLEWLNYTFSRLITPVDGGQPAFRALDQFRPARGSVTLIGHVAHASDARAEDVRRAEAAELAATISRVRTERWLIGDADAERPAGLGDVAILVPARTLLPFIEDAFLDAGIPYQAENSSLVYATSEIRDLLMTARCIADVSDELALIASLRSPLFGCSDADLFRWKQRGGRWRLGAEPPVAADVVDDERNDPVSTAMQWLTTVWQRHQGMTPSQLLTEIVTERRMFETALAGPAPRDAWRRLRFVLDQARAWADVGGVGLRHYLDWTRRLGSEGRYVTEGVLPETDVDAVRIMTVHAAKGLEFPIVVVAGLSTKPNRGRRDRVVWTTDSWDLAKGEQHELFRPLDEQLGHLERLRLLYVACTRARDHLVVSVHRTSDITAPAENCTSAELIAWAADGAPHHPVTHAVRRPADDQRAPAQLDWAGHDEWSAERHRVLASAGRALSMSATRFAERLAADDPAVQKDAVDLEQPPWQRGRYGTAIGRAVHGVLQAVNLHAPQSLRALAVAQAAAEGVDGHEDTVEALAASALAAPTVRSVAIEQTEYWQELYIGAPLGETVVEGYVDLLVRTPQGLLVVDYKTDHTDSEETLQRKAQRYAPQLAVYGVALERLLDEPIVGGVLVFCRATEPAQEIRVPDWRTMVDQVGAQLLAEPSHAPAGGV